MIAPEELIPLFESVFYTTPDRFYFAPGRVNIIGEHIDYNGGWVMPAAISMGITALVEENNSDSIRVYSTAYHQTADFNIREKLSDKNEIAWLNYIKGMADRVSTNGVSLKGMDILIANDLPQGTGLSSSAALECLSGLIFNPSYENNRVALALDAQKCENHFVGVNCGIMDQFAVSLAKENHAILLNCNSLEYQNIRFNSSDYIWVIINSNKPRELSKSKYNERRSECEAALKILNNFQPEAKTLCDVNPVSLAYIEDEILYARAKHVISENIRVQKAVNAMTDGKIDLLGDLLIESHNSLSEDYEVSCDELDAIVYYSLKVKECVGARMTGAGFGGCCIALVEKDSVEKFSAYVRKKYKEKAGLEADIYPVNFSEGVRKLSLD